jgi:hypothetical protein
VGRGLYDGLITSPKQSYRVSKYRFKTSKRRPRLEMGCITKDDDDLKGRGHLGDLDVSGKIILKGLKCYVFI